MIILGLDTALSAFGYAVIATQPQCAVIEMGTWRTKPDPRLGKLADRALRVESLGARLLELIGRWKPNYAAVESLALGMKTGMGTVQTLGRIRGLVEGICLVKGIKLSEIRPEQLKLAICGEKGASKAQVANTLALAYKLAPGLDENATDALAVAHVAASRLSSATPNVVANRDAGPFDPLDVDY